MIKTKRGNSPINDPIWAGGGGEFVELRSWENDLISRFQLNDTEARLHHDIALTEEGNILMIAWEAKTKDEAIAAGRNPDLLASDVLWSEMILEWNPFSDEIVWEWHAWDHLIQEYDSLQQNYGTVSMHPHLIDINYDEHDGHQDWLHINSIDYNPILDQIVLSIPYFNELWIIDHSTNTEEAARNTGGRSGKGGDLLYRWGNPAAYQSGTIDDKKLFFQHDVKWVNPYAEEDSEQFGLLSLFNNRVNERYSTANLIQTSISEDNTYTMIDNAFGPFDFEEVIAHPDTIEIAVSSGLSSAQFLSGGGVLIHSGRWGYTYELDSDGKLVWEYRVPIRGGVPVEQGAELSINNNITFKMDRYELDYSAFDNRDLTPGPRIELSPNATFCDVVSSVDDIFSLTDKVTILGNPSYEEFNFHSIEDDIYDLIDMNGTVRNQINVRRGYNSVPLINYASGLYIMRSSSGATLKFLVVK